MQTELTWATRGGFLIAAATTFCGCGSEPAPGSTVSSPQTGGGGNAGSGGSLVLIPGSAGGGSGGTLGIGGGSGPSGGSAIVGPPAGVELHACPPEPDPACPPKNLAGDASVSSLEELAALQGVTNIEGDLTIDGIEQLDALACLESVGDNVEIDSFGTDDTMSLYGLRHLKTVGGSVDLSASFHPMYPDCGLSRLESLGSKYLTGGAVDTQGEVAWELDLSSLKEVTHIRIKNSALARLILPDGVTLKMGQLALLDNPGLVEVAGFAGVTIQQSSIKVSGTYSVLIKDNPLLAECRANELAQLFLAAGVDPTSVTVAGNEPCAM